ncbi:mechanosensitive ion channel domain-containing protein [Roseibacillus persicicus]|uniref:mechanosensitive ion channel domain-containing protein n=1 Tax=Roseibacillus persicicus TaxID=454148 RepID=UPI0028105445|nr:mechanosensitive ion channel domain-containing protein [Roseibacillus persicicus]MDQ8191763.1 mechanosensitive ion channel [Roseibacillus persicicus]
MKFLIFVLLLFASPVWSQGLSSEEIDKLVKSEEAAGEDATSQAALAAWKSALSLAQQLEELNRQTKELRQKIEAGPSQPDLTLPDPLPESAGLTEQTARLAEINSAIEASRSRIDQSTSELDGSTARITELSEQIAKNRDLLSDVQIPAEGTTSLQKAEYQKAVLAKALLQARIENFQAEQDFQQMEMVSLPERLRVRKEHLAQLLQVKDRLQASIAGLRKEEAQSTSESLDASFQKLAHIPELATVINDIRQFNERRTGENGLQSQIKSAASYEKSVNALWDRIKNQKELADQKIKLLESVEIGIDTKTGLLLREQRAELQSTDSLQRTMREKVEQVAQNQISLLDLLDELKQAPLKTSVINRLVKENPELTKNEVNELLAQRKSLLEALTVDYRSLNDTLTRTNSKAARTIEAIESYSTFLDKRLLWIRSTTPLQASEPLDEWKRVVGLFHPDYLKMALRSMGDNWPSRLIPTLLLVTTFLFTLIRRRKLREFLKSSSEQAARRNCLSIRPTLVTIACSFLMAFTWPSLLFLLALLISEPEPLRVGLLNSGVFLLVGLLLMRFAKKETLFEAHFRFSSEKVERVRWVLRIFVPAMFFFVFGIGALTAERGEGDSGRLVFILGMLLVTGLAHFLFHPKHSIVRGEEKAGWVARLSYPLAIGLPVSFAVGAALGFFASVLTLRAQVLASAGVLLAAFLIIRFFTRWILVSRRRLAISQALQRREATLAHRNREEKGETDKEMDLPSLEEVKAQAIDVVEVEEQTSRLVRFCVYFSVLFAIWSIWSSSLVAFSKLDTIPVNPFLKAKQEEVSKPAPVIDSLLTGGTSTGEAEAKSSEPEVDEEFSALTEIVGPSKNFISWQDLILAVFIAALTVVAARNIPGLLSLAVFNRLNLGPGGNFAFTTVVRYVIVVTGLVVGLGKVGITWDKVQWLAAAITLGIGFGLQEIFANFVAGLILLFERPIRLGDVVTVGDVSGKVTEIKIRATTIQQFNNRELVVPNKDFITSQLINWTLRDTVLRFEIAVGIAYGSDTRKAKEILSRLVNEHPNVLDDPAPGVIFNAFGASTLDFLIRAHVGRVENLVDTQSELHFQIDDAFREAGIEISFPQQDLHIRSLPEGVSLQPTPPAEG